MGRTHGGTGATRPAGPPAPRGSSHARRPRGVRSARLAATRAHCRTTGAPRNAVGNTRIQPRTQLLAQWDSAPK
eukprot:3656607-Lingulodinium_polyedra.AAC.1